MIKLEAFGRVDRHELDGVGRRSAGAFGGVETVQIGHEGDLIEEVLQLVYLRQCSRSGDGLIATWKDEEQG